MRVRLAKGEWGSGVGVSKWERVERRTRRGGGSKGEGVVGGGVGGGGGGALIQTYSMTDLFIIVLC